MSNESKHSKFKVMFVLTLATLSFVCVSIAQETSGGPGSTPADVCPTPESCLGVYQFVYSRGVFEVTNQFTIDRASSELNLLWTSPEERARAEEDPVGVLSGVGISMTPMVFSQMTPDDLAAYLPLKLGGPPPPHSQPPPPNLQHENTFRVHTPKWILVAMAIIVVIAVIILL